MEKVKLGDVSILINGDRGKNYPSQADITENGAIPFVNAGHLNGRNIDFDEMNYISQDKYDKLSSGKFQKGDILYCLRGSLGKKAIVNNDVNGAIASSLVIIRPDKDRVSGEYLMLALDSPAIKEQLVKANNGSSQPNLSAASVREYEIELPELSSQSKVVEKLAKVRNVIDRRQQELTLLDDLIKARFVELFGDVTTGNYKYETRKLGDVANVGSSHRVFTTEFVEEGIPFYRGTEIGELANGIKPTEPYYISEEHYNRLANDDTKPQIGDLLMPSICNKGQVWMVDTDKPFYYKDGRVLCISPDRQIFNTKYLEYFMRVKTLVEYPKLGSGSTFAEFKIFLLKDIDVLIPPRELQNQFADFVKQVDKSKVAVKKALDEAQLLFDSLMQKYFG